MKPQSVDRDQLARYLHELLAADAGPDFGPNGLQVEGRAEIRRLVTGVSACQELFVRARAQRADAVLVHHGLFWDGMPAVLTGVMLRRVRELIAGEISLFAYHLPLDRHPTLGNNSLAAQALGLVEVKPFALYRGLPLGFHGRFVPPLAVSALSERCAAVFQQAPLTFGYGPDPVRSLGIVSGGAQRELWSAISAGLDAYLTGEASEWVMNVAKEAGIHYFAAGHYATERLGVRALGEHLADHFGLDVEFIDIPNPV